MKIAINTLSLYTTKVGMGKYIAALVNRVPSKDMDTEYIIYISEKNKHFFDFHSPNITVKNVSVLYTRGLMRIVWEQLFLPFCLWKNQIHIYHSPGFVLPLFRIGTIKYVVTIADMTFFSHPHHHLWFKRIYFQACMPFSIKNASRVITISENTKKDVLTYVKTNEKKIKAIYLGTDEIFHKEKKIAYILKKYKMRYPYIFFVGMIEPRKNILSLIKAFSSIKEKKNHILVIAGKKGWQYEQIFSYIKQENITKEIMCLGYVPDEDLPALYSGATCFIYPSFYEGFGIPIIEAMACGCPVITSNNSSMKEIAGNAALLIDPYAIQSIKNAMELLIHNEKQRNEMQKRAYMQAKQFNWGTFAKQTIELYHSLQEKE